MNDFLRSLPADNMEAFEHSDDSTIRESLYIDIDANDDNIHPSEMCRRMMDVAPMLSPLQDDLFNFSADSTAHEELTDAFGGELDDMKKKLESLKIAKKSMDMNKSKKYKRKMEKKKDVKSKKCKRTREEKDEQWKPHDSNRFDRLATEPKLCKKKRHK